MYMNVVEFMWLQSHVHVIEVSIVRGCLVWLLYIVSCLLGSKSGSIRPLSMYVYICECIILSLSVVASCVCVCVCVY